MAGAVHRQSSRAVQLGADDIDDSRADRVDRTSPGFSDVEFASIVHGDAPWIREPDAGGRLIPLKSLLAAAGDGFDIAGGIDFANRAAVRNVEVAGWIHGHASGNAD